MLSVYAKLFAIGKVKSYIYYVFSPNIININIDEYEAEPFRPLIRGSSEEFFPFIGSLGYNFISCL